MYRLVLYGLIVMAVYAIICGFLGGLSYSGPSLIISLTILLAVCFAVNWLFARFFHLSTNVESWAITALILFFLFMPVTVFSDVWTLVLAGTIAMASKYILARNKKHIFNPAAIAAFLLSFHPNTVALWWVGTPIMLPVVAIIGFLVIRKVRKFSLFFSFVIASILSNLTPNFFPEFPEMVLSGPLIFLGSIMLIEPLTMAPTRKLQVIYGVIVGLLYSTPELALVLGNIFSYIVSPKQKFLLSFKQKQTIAKDTYEFIFEIAAPSHSPRLAMTSYRAGQYIEWTLSHPHSDSRGVRRYFTIASSPTEEEVRLGVRISLNPSSFKRRLLSLSKGDLIIASSLAGDFVLPDNASQKLVFIAGGIGVTPFRSMIGYLIKKQEKRDIVLLYFNKTEEEIAYKDIFDKAREEINLKTVYILTDKEHISNQWKGEAGRLDESMLLKQVPDFKDRTFYISGPNALVNSYKSILLKAGVGRRKVKSDFFAGY